MQTIIHADDFGINQEQSQIILDCSTANGGLLTSTSAIVGSPDFPACAELARPLVDAGVLKMGLHVNLVEGPCCADPADIPLLVDEDGKFKMGFVELLAKSANDAALADQLKAEIRAQIDRFLEAFPQLKDALRLDSHQHFHMIPAVFDAMLQAADEAGCTIEYVRIPAEPLRPYLEVAAVRRKVPPVNIVKNMVLNSLWKKNKASYEKNVASIPDQTPATFFGVALSGRMYEAMNVDFIEKMERIARTRGSDLEILFHPAGVESIDECLDPTKPDFTSFYLSENRKLEAQAIAG